MNMYSKKYTYNLVLAHSGSKGGSKYAGGFVQKNGRKNNSSAYNHDYYMKNKEKWMDNPVRKGRSGDKQENDFHKDFEETMRRTGKTAQELYDADDFDTILMESGGYDTDNMSTEEKTRLKENFKKRFGVNDNKTSEYRARAAMEDAEYNVRREMARTGHYQGKGRYGGSAYNAMNSNVGRQYFKSGSDYLNIVNYNDRKKKK